MRRIVATAGALLAAGLLVALPAIGDDGGPYRVRAIFDNGGFVVSGEEVRVAGARVGQVESVDVSGNDEIVSREGDDHAIPGKAVVVLAIEDDGFKDFRTDATCIIRPQSLIGEKYVDCTPTKPRSAGSEPPPELEEVPDGEPGAGQRLLPLENNAKIVDLDLIQNIQRAPYRDRFRIILNELGAGLAGRGEDLGEIIERANPALRETDEVLNILAQQNRALASLASNGDAVLEPLARERTHVTGFIANANEAAQATAERRDDLEAGLQRLPRTLREVRLTMGKLRNLADQGAPLFEDLRVAAPGISKATQKLAPFANAAIPSFDTLGDAAQAAGPKLAQSDPVVADIRDLTDRTTPASTNLAALLDTLERTNGFQYIMDFIYNTVGSVNGFDQFGHYLRTQIQLTACLDYVDVLFSGCEATFPKAQAAPKKKKKKKKKKASKSVKRSGGVAPVAPALPPPPSPESPAVPDLPELFAPEGDLEPLEPPPADQSAPSYGEGPSASAASRTETGLSMVETAMLLDFLLGSSP